jgi:hypothetical protein
LKREAAGIDPVVTFTPGIGPEGCVYPDSRCCSVILVNQPAESIDADDYTVTAIAGRTGLRRLERQSAVRSFFVVVPTDTL